MCVYKYIYIYTYRERERERQRVRDRGRERERERRERERGRKGEIKNRGNKEKNRKKQGEKRQRKRGCTTAISTLVRLRVVEEHCLRLFEHCAIALKQRDCKSPEKTSFSVALMVKAAEALELEALQRPSSPERRKLTN